MCGIEIPLDKKVKQHTNHKQDGFFSSSFLNDFPNFMFLSQHHETVLFLNFSGVCVLLLGTWKCFFASFWMWKLQSHTVACMAGHSISVSLENVELHRGLLAALRITASYSILASANHLDYTEFK